MNKPCHHCGITTIPAHSSYSYLCCECGKTYGSYMSYKSRGCLSDANKKRFAEIQAQYTRLGKLGFRVPKEFRQPVDYLEEYKKHMEGLNNGMPALQK